jgi:hypothetical protein
MLQLRTIYTKTVRSIIAKIPIPASPHAGESIKLNDGSLFISLKEKVPSTANCPIIPNKCGRILSEAEAKDARLDSHKFKSLGKFCGKYGVSRSYAINKLNLQKEKLVQEEKERIEKMSDNKKRGLIMRRLIRKDRFESF